MATEFVVHTDFGSVKVDLVRERVAIGIAGLFIAKAHVEILGFDTPVLGKRVLNAASNDVTGECLVQARSVSEKWLRDFGQIDKWIVCLTAGTVVPANQEKL